jgi:hypothetical protein
MTGGTISGNTASKEGGGVDVNGLTGTFTKTGGGVSQVWPKYAITVVLLRKVGSLRGFALKSHKFTIY